jgi:hypothetical protein
MFSTHVRLYLSDEEKKLFTKLGYSDILDCPIEVLQLYRLVAEELFISGTTNTYVEAFRRGFKAIIKSECYRKTQEFDDLLRVD